MGGQEAIVINRLTRWAKWKMESGVQLGFKSHVNFLRLAGGSDWRDESIDSECIETNQAVEQLPELHKALIRVEYLSTMRDELHKVHVMGCCVRSFRQWKHDAHTKIANHLNLRLTMVPGKRHNAVNSSSCVQAMR